MPRFYFIGFCCFYDRVQPIIGHLKSDYRLNRNYLKGKAGDHANVVLAAAAYNIAKLLAWFYCPWDFKGLIQEITLKMPAKPDDLHIRMV